MRKLVAIAVLFALAFPLFGNFVEVRASSGEITNISISYNEYTDKIIVSATLSFYFDQYTQYYLAVRSGTVGEVVGTSLTYNVGAIGYDTEYKSVSFPCPPYSGQYTYTLYLYMRDSGSWRVEDWVEFTVDVHAPPPTVTSPVVVVEQATTTTTVTETKTEVQTMTERKFYELTRTVTTTVTQNTTLTRTVTETKTVERPVTTTITQRETVTKTETTTQQVHGGLIGSSIAGLIVGATLASAIFILRSRSKPSASVVEELS